MKPNKVRTIAICVLEHEGKLLVHDGYDEIKQQRFGRPLGGTIEFGEYSAGTIIRELHEEVRADVTNLRYLATIENIFTYNGQQGHEIVLVYRADLTDLELLARPVIETAEDDGTPMRAVWVPLIDFKTGKLPLYPSGLLELLDSSGLAGEKEK